MKNPQKKTSRIDTSNTSPKYWEKVLAEHEDPPSVDGDAMDHAAFDIEEPGTTGRRVGPVVFDSPNKKLKSSDIQRLVNEVNYGELGSMERGSNSWYPSVVRPANKDAVKQVPDWAMNNELTQALLLQAFPKLKENPRQRKQAARWAAIISLYYRNGWSQPYVYGALNMTKNAFKQVLKKIRRAAKAMQEGTGRARGRPKKETPIGHN